MTHSVSRVDSRGTHGFFVRIYRVDWEGNRSFPDSVYDGDKAANKVVAEQWAAYVDSLLPETPPKPELRKASVHKREDYARRGTYYYDVYLPPLPGEDAPLTEKLYFMTDDEQRKKLGLANKKVAARNGILNFLHRETLINWYVEHDALIEEINQLWKTLKIVDP